MFDYICIVPKSLPNEKEKDFVYKYPFLISEIFSIEIPKLIESLFSSSIVFPIV